MATEIRFWCFTCQDELVAYVGDHDPAYQDAPTDAVHFIKDGNVLGVYAALCERCWNRVQMLSDCGLGDGGALGLTSAQWKVNNREKEGESQ